MTNKVQDESKLPETDLPESNTDESNVDNEVIAEEKKSVLLLPMLVVISLLLAIGAAAGAGYTWFYAQQEQLVQVNLTSTLHKKIAKLEELQQQAQTQNNASQVALTQQQQVTSTRLDEISEKLGRSSYAWAVSEIRYTLRQASMRLQLFQEKETALLALKIADQQLAKLADPALHKVRATLNKEIIALSSVKMIDIEGISLTLSALSQQVKQLSITQWLRTKQDTVTPQAIENTDADVDANTDTVAWQKHADVIWSEMKSLISIRRTDKKILSLWSEQESQQLKQALGLKIEIARLALLQRNTVLFQTSLNEAISWLKEYFNAEQAIVAEMISQLEAMGRFELQPDFPDISAALSQLETWQNSAAFAKEKKAQ